MSVLFRAFCPELNDTKNDSSLLKEPPSFDLSLKFKCNGGREEVEGWGNGGMDIEEDMCCNEHWVL